MSTLQIRSSFTSDQMALFYGRGYVIMEDLLSPAQIETIVGRFDPLFATQFETGIYPDEWYGRPGLSQPNATRQMSGMWRCDRTLASVALSSQIAQLSASLMGWPGARYGLDACWIKPPGAPAVSFHRNSTYVSSLDPGVVVTAWIALSHCTAAAGTLEIVPGSHRWETPDRVRFLHAPRTDYRAPLQAAAAAAGVTDPPIMPVELPPGSAIFFHGNLWHGSNGNRTCDQTRRSLAISTLPATTQFQPLGVGEGFIYNRYRRFGHLTLEESYFPIVWSETGYRTPFLADYCQPLLS